MKNELSLVERIVRLIYRHINSYSSGECESILEGLHHILKRSMDFTTNEIAKIGLNEFQSTLAKINEKETRRKNDGVYYTPKDVTEYIVANAYLNFTNPKGVQVYSKEDCVSHISENDIDKLLKTKIFDPTCGTAEFLISAIEIKLLLLRKFRTLCDDDILMIASSIYGNDIAADSVLLSKVRIYFTIINVLDDKSKSIKLAKILNRHFTDKDYIAPSTSKDKYDIIVGNPPYVEYNKLTVKPNTGYGNIYADVLQNSVNVLKSGGVIGFVIPLSFAATARMQSIRNFMYHKMSKLFVMNFADRPDCLFDGVHQKLTILFGVKGRNKCQVYSSSYYHWYHDERNSLLDDCKVYPVVSESQYIPKAGNLYENSIFAKIRNASGISLTNMSTIDGPCCEIFMNMRACFWMKAFSFNPGSKEYKGISCPQEMKPYLLAILNSSLFFLYWTVVSDCWHITNKELSEFIVPIKGVCFDKFAPIATKLERKLEETKTYIGSVQTQYEYKHKMCKTEIDAIDDALQDVYGLTDDEVSFLKKYKLRYRMSYGQI